MNYTKCFINSVMCYTLTTSLHAVRNATYSLDKLKLIIDIILSITSNTLNLMKTNTIGD